MAGRQTDNRQSSNKTNTGKKTAKKSSTSVKKSTKTTKSTKSKRNQRSQVQDEITVLVVLAVSLILLLSNFNLAGNVGKAVKWFAFGLIGVAQYIFPIILACTLLFLISNKDVLAVARIKTAAVYVLTIMIAAAWQIISDNPVVEDTGIMEFFTYCADEKCGGGLFGGLLSKLLSPFGFWGSMVVIVIISIICIVLITEKSFIKSIINVKNSGSKLVKNARQDYDVYKEHSNKAFEENSEKADKRRKEKELRREERRLKKEMEAQQLARKEEKVRQRMQKKALGITKDTSLPKENILQGSSIDIKEIIVDTDRVDKYTDDIYIPDTSDLNETYVSSETINDADVYKTEEISDAKNMHEIKEPEYVELVRKNEHNASNINHNHEDEMIKGMDDNKSISSESKYVFPPIDLLKKISGSKSKSQNVSNKDTAIRLQQTLQNFGVKVTITDISCGPTVTRYEMQPEMGVKVSKIVSLADDIKLNLAAADIRIEAPIPGKAAVGIEVPNKEAGSVGLRELIESDEFKGNPSAISFAAGKDIAGKTIVADIAKMPHMLIAGATGSGKSVCINTIIMSILYKAHPDDVKLIMVDPKVVELSVYNGIPHLLTPVVTDPKKASSALNWAVAEMTDRYKKFAQMSVRDLKGYNEKISKLELADGEERPAKLPQIVIIIDELADLMMVAANEVEDAICRLAQLARACGIHLIIATQRPSVNVITGLIKANVPSKIAFSVASGVDSRIILDMNGAEKLLGRGDMLFFPSGYPKPVRVQGAFVSDEEVSKVVEFLKNQVKEDIVYNEEITNTVASPSGAEKVSDNERDAYFAEAARFVVEKEKASIGMLQRYYKIGFNRAGRIVDQLAEAGIVGPEVGTKPRKILMSMEELENYLKNNP